MPALPATPSGVISFRLHFEPNVDNHVYSKFQMGYTGGPPLTSDLVALATDVSTAFGAHLASLLYSGDALFDVEAVDLANPSTPFGLYTATVAGTRSGTQVQNNFTNQCRVANLGEIIYKIWMASFEV